MEAALKPDRPVLAISLGDPSGIGAEVTARAIAALDPDECVPVVYGGRAVWERACASVGMGDMLEPVRSPRDAKVPAIIECDSTPIELLPWGLATVEGGRVQAKLLENATNAVLSGLADGLVTAPVNKKAIHDAGLPDFQGHTEYLQARFGVPRTVMLMAGRRLRVALATNHLAIKDVASRLDADELLQVFVLLERELRERFGIPRPKLAMCALNPHAGEGGRFGDEERRVIAPAMEAARRLGIVVEGPFPADGLFPRILSLDFDAVVATFHDQGLIPFKMLEFADGVNVTLGLPKPRTSPDHGTAYDIAGRGLADPRSMLAAIRMAARLARGGA